MTIRCSLPTALLPATEALQLESLAIAPDQSTATLAAIQPVGACPLCGILSHQIHSRYSRTLTDLPWGTLRVRLELTVRKFFCAMPACGRRKTYGTLLVDLERHAVVDLLPDRTAETLTARLRERPGIEIISRDRFGAYAEAATPGHHKLARWPTASTCCATWSRPSRRCCSISGRRCARRSPLRRQR